MKKQVQFNLRRTADVGRTDVAVKVYDDSVVVSSGATGESKTFPYVPGTPFATYMEEITMHLQNAVFNDIINKKNQLLSDINDLFIADESSFTERVTNAIQESFEFPP